MGDLSENFSRSEFACPCGCGFDTVDAGTLSHLEGIRSMLGDRRVTVTRGGGCRCATYNKKIGGAKRSQHIKARAADIVVEGVPPDAVADIAEELGIPGVGRYDTFTHVDSRTGPVARWDLRTKL